MSANAYSGVQPQNKPSLHLPELPPSAIRTNPPAPLFPLLFFPSTKNLRCKVIIFWNFSRSGARIGFVYEIDGSLFGETNFNQLPRQSSQQLHKSLPFLQIKKAVQNKHDHSNPKKNAVLADRSFPDHLVQIIGNIKRIKEGIPLCASD